jgi:hypothetical protein
MTTSYREASGKAARSLAIAFTLFAFVLMFILGLTVLRNSEARWPMIVNALVIPFALSSLPFLVVWSSKRREEHSAARARWKEDYRKSPEANLIRLH